MISTIKDLSSISSSADPGWNYLMHTIQDKRHFYQAALSKLQNDAREELAYVNTRKSPTFVKPPDRVNDTSPFPEPRLSPFDKMQNTLKRS